MFVGIEAAGVFLSRVDIDPSLPVDETTLTDAHPYPTPFMIPVQPAITVCHWLMTSPATTAQPIFVNLRIDFSINFFSLSHLVAYALTQRSPHFAAYAAT